MQKMTYIRIFLQLKELYFTCQMLSKFNQCSGFISYTIKPAYSLLCCKHISTTELLNKSHHAPINLS